MKIQLRNMIMTYFLVSLSISVTSGRSKRGDHPGATEEGELVCLERCSPLFPCSDGFKCVKFPNEESRCCDPRDICPSGIVPKSSRIESFALSCEKGTDRHYSERLKTYFCCPILTRFLKLLGQHAPIDGKPCWNSSDTCSCEPVANPQSPFHLDRSDNGRPVKVCFPPAPAMFIQPFIPCESNSDCASVDEAFCHGLQSGFDVYDELLDRIVHQGGLCAIERPHLIAPPGLEISDELDSQSGSPTSSGANCQEHSECAIVAGGTNSVPICNKNTTSGKVKTTDHPCGQHEAVSPHVFCGDEYSRCSRIPADSGNAYFCGEGGVCCRSKTGNHSDAAKKDMSMCPDTVTDSLNEPECFGYDPSNPTSGKCPQSSGKCHYGRCCPPVSLRGTIVDGIAQKAYVTNRTCRKSRISESVVHAFCNLTTNRYVVIGSQMEGSPKTSEPPVRGVACRFDSDCRGLALVCVRTLEEGVCYRNPWDRMDIEQLYAINVALVLFVALIWLVPFCSLCAQIVLEPEQEAAEVVPVREEIQRIYREPLKLDNKAIY